MLGRPTIFARRLLRWYDKNRRDLPWRLARGAPPDVVLDPYHVLVSETMLQQTQVATVIPYFHRFLEKFPTIRSLAAADEQQILRLWQGLGYYSRARNLHRAARKILSEFGGEMPRSVQELQTLPGVGRYTAGAIASIAFGTRAAVVDGNVARVLCRIEMIRSDPREPATQRKLWATAEAMVPPKRYGDFNSAMMELGSLVCTPREPKCSVCPVREHCGAFAAGVQEKIPIARKPKISPIERRRVLCLRHGDRWLIEQRPPTGRWASMWQFITRPAKRNWQAKLRAELTIDRLAPKPIGEISHTLSHRQYEFEVFVCDCPADVLPNHHPRAWVTLEELDRHPLPRPHLKIVQMLRAR